MIILANTTDKLQAVLATTATTQISCVVSYRDISTTGFTAGRQITNTNNTTAVDICNAPASGTQRIIDYITVININDKVLEITIRYNANGTTYTLFKNQFMIGEKIEYQEGMGFSVYNPVGGEKTLLISSLNNNNDDAALTWYGGILGENRTITDIRQQEIEGLSFSCVPNKMYYFEAYLKLTSSATGNGGHIVLRKKNTENNLLFFASTTTYPTTTTTSTYWNVVETDSGPTGLATSTASVTGNVAKMEGFIKVNTVNTDAIQFIFTAMSELNTDTITILAGSTFRLLKIE